MKPLDTSEEAWAIVEAGIAAMTPAERVRRAIDLTSLSHAFALAQLRRDHPDDDEWHLKKRLAERMYGSALIKAAFGDG